MDTHGYQLSDETIYIYIHIHLYSINLHRIIQLLYLHIYIYYLVPFRTINTLSSNLKSFFHFVVSLQLEPPPSNENQLIVIN